MSDAVWVAVIAAVPSTIAAMVALMALRKGQVTSTNVQQLQITVDGRMQELLAKTDEAAHLAGVAAGRVEERNDPLTGTSP